MGWGGIYCRARRPTASSRRGSGNSFRKEGTVPHTSRTGVKGRMRTRRRSSLRRHTRRGCESTPSP
eukprot:scaffold36406_cov197-Isochrysis_galbana.AAC.1